MANFDKNDFLRRTFATADKSKSGSIGKETVRKLLLVSGYDLTDVQLERKFKSLDKNLDGSVDVEEFLRIYENMQDYYPATEYDSIRAYFKLIDVDGDGYITVDEFTHYFTIMGDSFASIRDTIDKIDSFKDAGRVNIFGFIQHLKPKY
eukprot:TRINITY_DN283_c1_g1_i6.p1 TRINITY_DN283_c1_g1~~TRINITY_DN283_c1_g1_i6.p1  ORF type:complete len:149 (+),score=58.89 TRINITY_DN283_c1_g1_i6:46-492(+)